MLVCALRIFAMSESGTYGDAPRLLPGVVSFHSDAVCEVELFTHRSYPDISNTLLKAREDIRRVYSINGPAIDT